MIEKFEMNNGIYVPKPERNDFLDALAYGCSVPENLMTATTTTVTATEAQMVIPSAMETIQNMMKHIEESHERKIREINGNIFLAIAERIDMRIHEELKKVSKGKDGRKLRRYLKRGVFPYYVYYVENLSLGFTGKVGRSIIVEPKFSGIPRFKQNLIEVSLNLTGLP